MYETQLKMSARFGAPPPPVPPAIASAYPEVVEAHAKAAAQQHSARQRNPMEKVCVLGRYNFCDSILTPVWEVRSELDHGLPLYD